MGISQKGIIKYKGLPGDSAGKESACNVGDLGSIPELGRSLGEGNGCPLQYFGPENSIDCIVHVVTKSQTQLSDFHFTIKCKVIGIDYFWKHSLLGPEFHGASNFFFFFCWLVPLPGIKPASPALEAQNLNHWATREVSSQWNFNWYFSYLWKYHLGTIFHTYIWSIRESGWLFFQNKSQVCPRFPTSNVKNLVQVSII